MNINPLSDILFAHIVSYSVVCLLCCLFPQRKSSVEIIGQENADLVAGKKLQVKECGNLIAVIKMKAHLYAS